MEELIQKLEKATEGSEELDALIVAALNDAIVRRYPPTDDFGPKNRWQFWSRDGAHFLGSEHNKRFKIAPLTTSLDAALTLVPAECDWLLNSRSGYAEVWDTKESGRDGSWSAQARTMPLALCIAALKARLSLKGDS